MTKEIMRVVTWTINDVKHTKCLHNEESFNRFCDYLDKRCIWYDVEIVRE